MQYESKIKKVHTQCERVWITNLWAGVVENLDVCIEGMVHGIRGTVISVSQVPQQFQHLNKKIDKGYLQLSTCTSTDKYMYTFQADSMKKLRSTNSAI